MFWKTVTEPEPRRDLLAQLFERVWIDGQRVAAVKPTPAFAPLFATPTPERTTPPSGRRVFRRNYGSDGTWFRSSYTGRYRDPVLGGGEMYQMPPEDLYAYAQVEMGRRIRRARKALGWTQEDLGDATGIDQTRISVFERGRKSMHLRTFLKLANALDVDPADLVRGLKLPKGGDARDVAMTREHQRYEEEVTAVMTEANRRLDAARTDHDRRVANVLRTHGRTP